MVSGPLPPGQNPPLASQPLDASYDALSTASVRAMADVARAVISAEGVRWVKAQVKGTVQDDGRRFVTIRRPENDFDDVKPYPVLSAGSEPEVGDWVNALETAGGLVILGKEQWSGAPTIAGLREGTDLRDGIIKRRHIEAGAIGGVELSQSYSLSSHDHGWNAINNKPNTYPPDSHSHSAYTTVSEVSALIPNSTGSELSGSYRHSHSISSTTFIKLSKEERKRMLGDRNALELLLAYGGPAYSERIIAQNTLNLLTLLMDYRGLNAFEREERFGNPEWAEWTENYKRVYGVDEYSEEDRNNFLDYGPVRMDPYEGIAPVEEH